MKSQGKVMKSQGNVVKSQGKLVFRLFFVEMVVLSLIFRRSGGFFVDF